MSKSIIKKFKKNNKTYYLLQCNECKNIQETYFGILNQELQDGNFVKIIEDNVTGYKLTLNGEELKNVLVKLMETLKNDQTTLDTINGYIKSKVIEIGEE